MDIDQLFQYIKDNYKSDEEEYFDSLPPEDDKNGNIEYKLKLIKLEEKRLQELECQMLRRIEEGIDHCYYWIGVEDNGNTLGLIDEEFFFSLKTLSHIANKNECDFQILQIKKGERGKIALVKLKQRPRSVITVDIRIQLMGESASGKTTLFKSMYEGEVQNNSQEEKTNQIKQLFLCFNSDGTVLSRFPFNILGPQGMIELATKIITFQDIGGQLKDKKYFVQSYCSRIPNYGELVISAKKGLSPNDKNHIQQAISIGLVFFIVITQIDLVQCDNIGHLICEIKNFIYQNYQNKQVQVIYTQNQIAKIFTEQFTQGDLVPIFMVSNKTMVNIELLINFLSQLPDNRAFLDLNLNNECEQFSEFTIHNPFEKSKINTDKKNGQYVFLGTVLQGDLVLNQKLLLGPDFNGFFKEVQITQIIIAETSVETAQSSQICVVKVKADKEKTFEIRKGQVLVDPRLIPRAAYEFIAELSLFDSIKHRVAIKTGYQPVVNFQSIRQSCKIMVTKDDLEGKGYRPLIRRKSLEREMRKKAGEIVDLKVVKFSTQGEKIGEEKTFVFSKNMNSKFLRRTKSIEKIQEIVKNEEKKNNTNQPSLNLELIQQNKPVIFVEPQNKCNQNIQNLKKYDQESKNYLRMRFKNRPERIKIGQTFIIYDETLKAKGKIIKDKQDSKPLNIHESKIDGIYVEGLSEYQCTHYYDAIQLMKRGEKNRKIRQTQMNNKSSRSHTILQFSIESTNNNNKNIMKRSKVNLCDLAGSEKINKNEIIQNDHFNELKNINQSLSTLGKIIYNLSCNQKLPMPFRESKLTRILQDSLTGNCKTIVIGNISPSLINIEETISTLKFVDRAKNIIMKVKPNQLNTSNQIIVQQLQREGKRKTK
ncbi:kinesin motor domain protein [Ichthyophthirius multifiliis]|uniref:Kinesin-like protein n=1 Tax=Ichthyophthirius multifiliis TaxID=5932 RepID=G0QVL6_ICHMU|nr:kinesin motor domain protein [Ichthyophthirius multifiliis]EGR30739.1 kinesin motor domain protein [Ichthyophthirius multifiliis]|eukprot:XP_004032326.1 kinesin motor domain protein [Ichthyophthirius multifiliis]